MTVDNLWLARGPFLSTATAQFRYKLPASSRMSFDGGKSLMKQGKSGLFTAGASLHNHRNS
jgi:hypothetical protein